MPSKRRLRRRSCTYKHKFVDKDVAFAAVRRMRTQGKYGVSPYKCGFCSGWHIGRPNKRKRQGMRARRGY